MGASITAAVLGSQSLTGSHTSHFSENGILSGHLASASAISHATVLSPNASPDHGILSNYQTTSSPTPNTNPNTNQSSHPSIRLHDLSPSHTSHDLHRLLTHDTSADYEQFFIYLAISFAYVMFTAFIVNTFAPTARGSGIPEVKTILGGFHMPDVLSFRTLVVKCIGLTLVVAAGMSLGKEGPLVHVSCCLGVLCSNLHSRYSQRY